MMKSGKCLKIILHTRVTSGFERERMKQVHKNKQQKLRFAFSPQILFPLRISEPKTNSGRTGRERENLITTGEADKAHHVKRHLTPSRMTADNDTSLVKFEADVGWCELT